MNIENIFTNVPESLPREVFSSIISTETLKVERIVSKGHTSPPGEWYDQSQNEWVIVLKGDARIEFENKPDSIVLKEGDYINIPAHCRHRVEYTSTQSETIWLAIHY